MGDGSGGANTADSYIGSLISLTSKSEIRYEGILYTVDTENSNIALQNVRSFGTEGRKKEGPPIYASDKVYDYIIFRGSDIKDLQVKSSPSLQPPPQPPTDPAIISLQSQYSQPASIPPAYAQPPPGPQDAPPQLSYQGLPPSAFRGGVPHMYQPAAAWGPPPTGPNGNLAMPMYWPGYYRSPGGQLMQQQMPPQPPPSLPQPPIPQHQAPLPQPQVPLPQPQALPPQIQSRPSPPSSLSSSIPSMSSQVQPQPASAPASAPAPAPALSSSVSMPAVIGTVPAIPPVPPSTTTTLPTAVVTAPLVSSSTSAALSAPPPVSAASASVPPVVQGISAVVTPASKNPRRVLGAVQSSPPQSQTSGASVGASSAPIGFATFSMSSTSASVAQRSSQAPTQPPGILSASGKTAALNPLKQEQKAEEPVISQSTVSVPGQTQQQETQPLLPLPTASTPQKQTHHANGNVGHAYVRRGRGRGTGRGVGLAQPTQKFTEDFDFIAMNEKFNKDEVWGELGGGRADGKDKAGEIEEEEVVDGNVDDEIVDGPSHKGSQDGSKMPQYVKDDFFDSLSCDAIDREEGRAERTKFSEQRKIDTETFGNFPLRSRGGRRGGRRGGFRGGYYGGGYMGGRGNGYGRGRGPPRSATAIN